MTKLEKARALRNDPAVHYNCAQAVLMTFAGECGLDEQTAYKLCEHFGGGMRMAATCGAVTGAMLALGGMGADDSVRRELVARFKTENGFLDCKDLLKQARDRGEEKKSHCDRMVEQCVALVEELTANK